MTLDDLEGH